MIPLRDRIADLLAHHPAFSFKDEGYSAEDVLTMADAVIRELGLQPHLAKRIINGKPDQWVLRFTTDWEIVDD